MSISANECAATIRASLANISPTLTIDAQSTGEGEVMLVLTVLDAQGRVEEMKEQQVRGLVSAAAAAGVARFEAYLSATAGWLRAQKDLSTIFAHPLFVFSLLGDARLVTAADFAAVFMNPPRHEIYVAYDELRPFFERHGLRPANDDVVRALFALTPEGRATKGLDEAVRAIRWLASSDWGRVALVAMLCEWADEEYDPYDLAWERGPAWPTLLISGTWRALDPVLQGEPRMRALASVNRLPRPVDGATLARVGF